ncbi:hypothetical protein CGCF415_v005394 [Colletotrichum fructicola]|uniref:Uncharacterized protein n=1 Tax=Colletotrichum fructicola (strain Nara gc5) TaxID=1213859 RepID=A0A7J6IIA8_COLFN|nr:hypothetical protein CFRS1_v003407 [Colletotrichum fructicola]KAF4476271.1 hypothetical protein CGGC5_v015420 [Colletotrichum fructicola Nara gc5]KAF4900410.1 hypothetical protein CGCFRS4_v003342 [Colletotrichum fructicola]KAF4910148.1 hypothetical protein CGCF415_v005394 [Colletotrichum fructicola]KAF4933069.1 hypothetical protein CGCF245_v010004 [Colletotrichum fructicola]
MAANSTLLKEPSEYQQNRARLRRAICRAIFWLILNLIFLAGHIYILYGIYCRYQSWNQLSSSDKRWIFQPFFTSTIVLLYLASAIFDVMDIREEILRQASAEHS